MSIDFQGMIDSSLRQASKDIIKEVIYNHTDWCCSSLYKGDNLRVWVWPIWNINADHSMTFDLAGRAIDAALLEQLHNEVTAWFTAIKEGTSG